MTDPDEAAAEFAHRSLEGGDVTGWFEPLYAAAAQGDAVIPWDRGAPHPMLLDWAAGSARGGDYGPAAVDSEGTAAPPTAPPDGGRSAAVDSEGIAAPSTAGRALVVGSGPGHDAEYLTTLGYDTTAFDVSESAITAARQRYPDTTVDYQVANLFDLPAEWHHHFDLVVEVMTVQAMPRTVRADATTVIRELVAPGGTLLVIGMHLPDDWTLEQGPPWPLTAEEIEAFATDGLHGELTTRPSPTPGSSPHYRYTLTRYARCSEVTVQ